METELGRRFPGRELKTATTPDGLRTAWVAVEMTWVEVMLSAAGLEDVSVDGEWSLSQTLRHLVMATNAWLHGAILGQEQPFHWIGQPFAEYEPEGGDMTIFREPASYNEILAVRSEHQAMVRDYLTTVTDEVLAETRPHVWAPEYGVQVLHCLHPQRRVGAPAVRRTRPPESRWRLAPVTGARPLQPPCGCAR